MRLSTILVATDLSEGSDAVVAAAAAIAEHTGATLHLVHAFELELLPYVPEVREPTLYDLRHRDAEQRLEAQALRLVPDGVRIGSRRIVSDRPHRAIATVAEEAEPDLVVIGPHRKAPVGDAFLGSTADRVLRTTAVPCLVVRGSLPIPVTRVLAPIDLSEAADHALDAALGIVQAMGTPGPDRPSVVAMHVIPAAFQAADFAFDREVVEPEVRRAVEGAIARAGAPADAVQIVTQWGDDPAAAIGTVSQREGVQLVVLGTHGHSGLRRALIGSVASAVARSAPVPVLLVPPPPG